MPHYSKLKKLIAGALGTAVMASSMPVIGTSTAASSADNNYYEALALSLYFFDANACGSDITDGPLTWRGNCHTYDGKCPLGTLGSEKSVVDPDGDGFVDLDGGFHDAGDHIKFNLTIGFSMSSLAMSEYLNPGIYTKAGCQDHFEYELRRGADYLMKTTFLDGSGNVAAIAHVVADGGADHGIWSAPETQTYDRPAFWLTASDNNSAVCGEMAAALAGTAYVFKETDKTYAEKCLKYAKALFDFGKQHKGNNCGGIGGYYSTDAMCEDELSLAQAWLWINGAADKPEAVMKNGGYNGVYDGWLYTWDKVWQGYDVMMYKATKDSVYKDEILYELNNRGGLSTSKYMADGWGASRYNCAKQMDALALAEGDPDSEYAKQAKYQMDFILGNNPSNKSFLVGYGTAWPTKIHHRAANVGSGTASDNSDATYTAYGALIGGPDSSGSYEDNKESYTCTEPALDYNGCFALACAGLASLYGGDASAITPLITSVSEINEKFVFGSGNTEPPTDPTQPTEDTTSNVKVTLWGDSNCDDNVNMADAVLIMQAIANADEFGLGKENGITEIGWANADVAGNGDGVTLLDAQTIQAYTLELIDELPYAGETEA